VTTRRFAFFDDYPHERGHHPDLIIGLALAARAPSYCPTSFLEGRPEAIDLVHTETTGTLDHSPAVTMANMERSYADAERRECEVLVNLFTDENWDAVPPVRRLATVQTVHRPGDLTGSLGGINRFKPGDVHAILRRLAERDLFVVHTTTGERQLRTWLPGPSVVRIGWPCATRSEIGHRLTAPRDEDVDPYVLLIGEARPYKGVGLLLEALEGGPMLRIAGNLPPELADRLIREHPGTRVTWEPGWIPRNLMNRLIAEASVVAFPYLSYFQDHGGVSAALVSAMTFGKPLVVSDALAAQTLPNASQLTVPCGDVRQLRRAIDRAMVDRAELQLAARALENQLLREHSYEGYLEQLTERLAP
jgi:glycosyltransferase involved in cell wall biosynthesis